MSCWTHIVATIDIDTMIQDNNIKERVIEILKEAPRITGSERDADVFVNVLTGHNIWTSCDCDSCSYKDTVVYHKNGSFSCDADENFKCPSGDYQTRVVVTIIGDLRDRLKERTKNEYKEFVKYLKKQCNFYIRNKTVKIDGN